MLETILLLARALCLSAAFAAAPPQALAQSGRVIPTPEPTPTPAPAEGPTPRLDPGPDPDAYKLIFPTEYEGAYGKGLPDRRGLKSRLESFIGHLNHAAERGYRLVAVTSTYPVAVVRLGEVQHEYAAYFTGSAHLEKPFSFQGAYAELSRRGLRLFDTYRIDKECTTDDSDIPPRIETCDYQDLYLFEREKGVAKPRRFMMVGVMPRWRAKPGEELTAQVAQQLKHGYYPAWVFSQFAVLLEQPGPGEAPQPGEAELRVVAHSVWGLGDLEKQVNELARAGYRMALANNGAVVMRRESRPAEPVRYVWLKAKERDFERRLAQLQAAGATYRMIYPDGEGRESRLIFEQRLTDDGRRSEFKVLDIDLQISADPVNKKTRVELAPASRDVAAVINRLAGEGYAVRDLFFTGKVRVLLERAR